MGSSQSKSFEELLVVEKCFREGGNPLLKAIMEQSTTPPESMVIPMPDDDNFEEDFQKFCQWMTDRRCYCESISGNVFFIRDGNKWTILWREP